MRKKLLLIVLGLTLFGCSTLSNLKSNTNNLKSDESIFYETVSIISDSLYKQIPFGSKVLLLDFKDLNDTITHFGKYLAEKISINLSKEQSIQTIDRNNIELILKEQQFQLSGLVSDESAVSIGKFIGASHIIFGTLTEFVDYVEVELKIVDVEKAIVIGGLSHKIIKSHNVASLVSIIVKSEEQQKVELEKQRKIILAKIEQERQEMLEEFKKEEKQKKIELKNLESEIRKKSIIIAEYEERKKELQQKQNYINQIHNEIDRLNSDVLSKLKIGMTKQQIIKVLGKDKCNKCAFPYDENYVCGRYFLIFEGNVLSRIVRNGSKLECGYIINDISSAVSSGINIGRY